MSIVVIVKITEMRHLSWFWVLMRIDLPPFLAIVLLGNILKKRGVSSMFPTIASQNFKIILLSHISLKNKEALIKHFSDNNYPIWVLVEKDNPFLLWNK